MEYRIEFTWDDWEKRILKSFRALESINVYFFCIYSTAKNIKLLYVIKYKLSIRIQA